MTALLVAVLLLLPAVASSQTQETSSSSKAANGADPALWNEPRLLSQAIEWAEAFETTEHDQPIDGFYPDFGRMITGAGWISVGPGYRRHLWRESAVIDVSAAVSWRAYKTAQARLEFPSLAFYKLAVGGQAFWSDYTQVRYFGTGPQSLETDASDYRVQAADAIAYAAWRPFWKVALAGSVGVLSRPGLSSSTGPFDRDEPDTMQRYADAPAATLARQPRFVHGDLSFTFDTRDQRKYPKGGGLYRGAWITYRDREGGNLTFDRWEAEALQFVPLMRGRGVLAFHWWAVVSDPRNGHDVPFYLLPSLGGGNTLRGYADYRFHDRNLIVANLESRWALLPHVDGALFFDAGSVAATVRDLNFDRTSYGFGFRLHTARTTVARLDIGRSDEGWRFLLKLNDPLRLRRLTRRTAALPFVP